MSGAFDNSLIFFIVVSSLLSDRKHHQGSPVTIFSDTLFIVKTEYHMVNTLGQMPHQWPMELPLRNLGVIIVS